jgi:cob(I)alamin adenosyltransferase
MKLYTKQGDDGGTVLFDGTRVDKNDPRVAAYGDVDELNSQIGLTIAILQNAGPTGRWSLLIERMTIIQNELFTLGAELATPQDAPNRHKIPQINADHSRRLETWIDDAVAPVAPLREFVLPGGCIAAAHMHICRTVCRRVERGVVALARQSQINPEVIIYLNRLSDLFFAWARLANHLEGVPDVPWKQ